MNAEWLPLRDGSRYRVTDDGDLLVMSPAPVDGRDARLGAVRPVTGKTCAFDVLGDPAPQGSKTSMRNPRTGKVVTLEGKEGQREKHRAWRGAVAEASREWVEAFRQFTGPTHLELVLYFRRPKSRPKSHHGWHTVTPDADKVLRSCLDGLKDGGLIADDSLICSIRLIAVETAGWTGATFALTDLT
jgi:Holliday junction resolvase RusA-like endonuclease